MTAYPTIAVWYSEEQSLWIVALMGPQGFVDSEVRDANLSTALRKLADWMDDKWK